MVFDQLVRMGELATHGSKGIWLTTTRRVAVTSLPSAVSSSFSESLNMMGVAVQKKRSWPAPFWTTPQHETVTVRVRCPRPSARACRSRRWVWWRRGRASVNLSVTRFRQKTAFGGRSRILYCTRPQVVDVRQNEPHLLGGCVSSRLMPSPTRGGWCRRPRTWRSARRGRGHAPAPVGPGDRGGAKCAARLRGCRWHRRRRRRGWGSRADPPRRGERERGGSAVTGSGRQSGPRARR